MKYTKLNNTDITVSKICLGTMTFGQQNTQQEGHEQISYAIENGINFIDTAEMYSVPGNKETQGSTEKIIGNWFEKNKNRDKIILASKIVGPSEGLSYIRDNMGFSKESIDDAINKSLKRLKTDYIDLYQLHWPERNTNFFSKRNFKYDENEKWKDNFSEIIGNLDLLKKEGKIRHYGISNETAWGLMRYKEESNKINLEKPVTIQNPYNLINRTFEIGLSEVCTREKIGLLAYSPLAFGLLTGKYLKNGGPKDARLNLFKQMSRYNNEESAKAVKLYSDFSKELGISLTQLSLAFVNSRNFVTSNIIGATNMEQLKENISSINVELTEEILTQIDLIQAKQPNPAP